MDKRMQLQSELERLVGLNVYFQPPATVQLKYPCVIYNLSSGNATYADNSVYTYTNRFELIFIYRKQNMEIVETVLRVFPMCTVSRVYIADNLYHYVFNLYY